MPAVNDAGIYRIIDANGNRALEGLRVCEDVARFAWDDKPMARRWKNLRHDCSEALRHLPRRKIIAARSVRKDVGASSTKPEFRREDVEGVFYANLQRVKESLRVLEECLKLVAKPAAQKMKDMRYKVYALEQRHLLKV
jgi:thiamine-phosphate pyrophosphorylase